jgi:hypothetical protein
VLAFSASEWPHSGQNFEVSEIAAEQFGQFMGAGLLQDVVELGQHIRRNAARGRIVDASVTWLLKNLAARK